MPLYGIHIRKQPVSNHFLTADLGANLIGSQKLAVPRANRHVAEICRICRLCGIQAFRMGFAVRISSRDGEFRMVCNGHSPLRLPPINRPRQK